VRRSGLLRVGLTLVAVSPLGVGIWALFAPRSFFDDFPAAGRHWVSAVGPYNEHLVRDVGALNLALGVLLVAAGVLLGRTLVRAAIVAWLIYAVPHLVFHASTLGVLSPLDDLANMVGLGLLVVLPLALLAVTGRGEASEAPSGLRRPGG